jgi:Uma2 family endonuclease
MIALKNPPSPVLNEEPTLKRWTVAEYHRMSELGILDADERTELIDGQILLMTAKGTPHTTALRLLASLFDDLFNNDRSVWIITQDPIQLDDFSEPEPDLVVVRGAILDYTEHHPYPEDIHLVVEIADSTLKQDSEVKDKLYAKAGISEYWVVDINNRQVNIFRNPTSTGYTNHSILKEPNKFSPLAFPHISIELTSILTSVA